MGEFGDAEIETGIVDQDDGVRLEPEQVFAAFPDPFQVLSGMQDDLGETHDGSFLVIPHETVAMLML